MRDKHPGFVAARFLLVGQTDEQRAAMAAVNPYRQSGMRQWFIAGWLAYGRAIRFGDGVTFPGMTARARVAYGRGVRARAEHEGIIETDRSEK